MNVSRWRVVFGLGESVDLEKIEGDIRRFGMSIVIVDGIAQLTETGCVVEPLGSLEADLGKLLAHAWVKGIEVWNGKPIKVREEEPVE